MFVIKKWKITIFSASKIVNFDQSVKFQPLTNLQIYEMN